MVNILSLFDKHVLNQPEKRLFAFLNIKGDIITDYTYRSFKESFDGLASYIQQNYTINPGDRVLLAYPAGLEMIRAFFACIRIGLIPVPVYPPSLSNFEGSLSTMKNIAIDCKASAIFTDQDYLSSIEAKLKTTLTKQKEINLTTLPGLIRIVKRRLLRG